jgi:hypothetical protein
MTCDGQQPKGTGFETKTRARRPKPHFAQQPIIKQNLYLPQINFNQVLCSKDGATETTSDLGFDVVSRVPK